MVVVWSPLSSQPKFTWTLRHKLSKPNLFSQKKIKITGQTSTLTEKHHDKPMSKGNSVDFSHPKMFISHSAGSGDTGSFSVRIKFVLTSRYTPNHPLSSPFQQFNLNPNRGIKDYMASISLEKEAEGASSLISNRFITQLLVFAARSGTTTDIFIHPFLFSLCTTPPSPPHFLYPNIPQNMWWCFLLHEINTVHDSHTKAKQNLLCNCIIFLRARLLSGRQQAALSSC